MRTTHVLLGNEKPLFGIFKELWKVRTVFHFSVEALLLKIITIFWKGKNFMKCLREKRTFVTLKIKTIVWDMWKNCYTWEQCSFSLYKLYFERISCSFESVWISWIAFVRNAHVFLWKDNPLFVIYQSIVRSENSGPFLCRSLLWKIITSLECVWISWDAFVRNTHVLLRNVQTLLGICQRIIRSENSVPFLCRSFTCFTLKINTIFGKCMNFMKCFCEKHTCVSPNREAVVWDLSKYC